MKRELINCPADNWRNNNDLLLRIFPSAPIAQNRLLASRARLGFRASEENVWPKKAVLQNMILRIQENRRVKSNRDFQLTNDLLLMSFLSSLDWNRAWELTSSIAAVWEFDAVSARWCCWLKERNFLMTTKVSLRPGSVAKCAGVLINGQADD